MMNLFGVRGVALKGRARTEAIEMRSRRFGYFPRTFVWRGHEYQVEAVDRVWTTGGRNDRTRHHFAVRCAEGRFNVYQDVKQNTWHIERGK